MGSLLAQSHFQTHVSRAAYVYAFLVRLSLEAACATRILVSQACAVLDTTSQTGELCYSLPWLLCAGSINLRL
jgi:hypothetical protein